MTAVAAGAPLAPFDADGLDWFAGMVASAEASLRAAAAGRAEKERHERLASNTTWSSPRPISPL
ncbi:hypothetical protein [Lentzea aerocolonigenes]|uniref:hypothetical protein n=1 Tax=Lentzea aerocolonigenes TaxID=68170 RepID=UPI0007C680A5